jgi:NAD(P)-dependent dehydrogenase (short-subunit alcohol dehydrogenase family)
MPSQPTGLAVLMGAGPTTASGIARILASPAHGNLAVALLSRSGSAELAATLQQSSGGGVLHAFATDTTAASLQRAFGEIRSHAAFAGLPLRLAVWNIKHSHKVPFEEETAERFEDSLRVYVGGARNFAAECTRWMLAQEGGDRPEGAAAAAAAAVAAEEDGSPMRKRGTLIFTGTLGALRTNAQYAAYGAGRAGVRMLAQSLAREYSARGVHVVHAIANGGITDSVEGAEGDKVRAGTKMRAESVGKTYLWLSEQECDLWVHELDMRPAAEKF